MVTEDGYGHVVGFPDAPVQVEIYTEPQCEHCADFQARFGEGLRSHIQSGQLAVAYRPLTFLDDEYGTDYSQVAANALFLAAAPKTSASTFQSFVEDVWANQGLALEEFTDDDFAALARESGVDAGLVAEIGAGARGVDAVEMNDVDISALSEVTSGPPGTAVLDDLKGERRRHHRPELAQPADAPGLTFPLSSRVSSTARKYSARAATASRPPRRSRPG